MEFGAWNSAFLTSSHVRPVLLVWGHIRVLRAWVTLSEPGKAPCCPEAFDPASHNHTRLQLAMPSSGQNPILLPLEFGLLFTHEQFLGKRWNPRSEPPESQWSCSVFKISAVWPCEAFHHSDLISNNWATNRSLTFTRSLNHRACFRGKIFTVKIELRLECYQTF